MAENLIEAEDSTEVEPDEAPKSRRWMLLIVGFVVLAAGVSGALLLYRRPSAADSPEAPPPHKVSAVLHLETFTVNLSDPDQKAFLRLGMDLGLDKDPKESNASASTAILLDTILTVLMATKSDDLIPPEGKKKLKDDLLHALQERAPELAVQEIYFTEFLLQR